MRGVRLIPTTAICEKTHPTPQPWFPWNVSGMRVKKRNMTPHYIEEGCQKREINGERK